MSDTDANPRPLPCWCDRGGSPQSGCPAHSFGTLTTVQRMALDKEMRQEG